MKFERVLSPVVDDVVWTKRDSKIVDGKGKTIFEQKDVLAPNTWSDNAVNITASKYFKTINGVSENSVKQLFGRVTLTLTSWGWEHKYFDSPQDAENFNKELSYILTHQLAAFNSPVFFNFGVPGRPHTPSACFLLSVDDSMNSILELGKTEGLIFTAGSGAGVNISNLRSETEPLSKGGFSSGPLSFMKSLDCQGGVIKSGGQTRRAARLVCMNDDHPNLLDFIDCKSKEEKKARALVAAGFSDGIDGEAYSTVAFQNANHSVRLSDAFMSSVLQDKPWSTRYRVSGEVAWTKPAREIFREIATHAWATGDPGIQWDDTINAWNTCSNTGRINTSNPCSEYHHLDNSSCNLASLNLVKFVDATGKFDVKLYQYVIKIMTTAMDISITNADFPTEKIGQVTRDYRELGLGFTNQGSLLMIMGLPYDSDQGRGLSFALTALLTGTVYKQSALIAKELGAFAGFERNREPMIKVLNQHFQSLVELPEVLQGIIDTENYQDIIDIATTTWLDAITLGDQYGYRNSQGTVIAPTGSIAYLMDCDTTGVEPAIGLVSYKKMVGGGFFKLVNGSVEKALHKLGYTNQEYLDIVKYIEEYETIEGAPHIKDKHLPVFDCANPSGTGSRYIQPSGHYNMMAAMQPFLSGAISKSINLPNHATIEDIEKIYLECYPLGLKSVAVYRDGSKVSQPLSTSKSLDKVVPEQKVVIKDYLPIRKKLPIERDSITHYMDIAGFEAYITAGKYPDGSLGEVFIKASKGGSIVNHLFDTIAILISYLVQYGIPLEPIAEKLMHTQSDPHGFTKNPDIPVATSIVDYIFKWLKMKFIDPPKRESVTVDSIISQQRELVSISMNGNSHQFDTMESVQYATVALVKATGSTCTNCGSLLVQSGICKSCPNCGISSGCAG